MTSDRNVDVDKELKSSKNGKNEDKQKEILFLFYFV